MTYNFVTVTTRSIEENFWEINPQLKNIPLLRNVFLKDKSKNKIESSKLMWSVWMYCDPSYSNKIFNLPEDIKMATIQNYYPSFDPSAKDVLALIESYDDLLLTAAARAFKEEVQSLVDRSAFIRSQSYSIDSVVGGKTVKGSAEMLDKLRLRTSQIIENYTKAKRAFEAEQMVGQDGRAAKTLREEGRLNMNVREDYETTY